MKSPALFKKTAPLYSDTLHWCGILLILISFAFFALSDKLNTSQDSFPALLVCYAITVIYTVLVFTKVIAKHGWKFIKGNINHTALMLLLWFISAFALNKEMNVFENSSSWLCVCLCLCSIAIIAATLRQFLPVYVKYLLIFFLGISAVLFAYYSIYLLPLYAIGVLAAIFIGLSLHVFIPILLLVLTTTFIIRLVNENRLFIYSLTLGLLLPIVACIISITQWNTLDQKISSIQNQNTLHESKLPEWVVIAQQIPQNFFTEKFLKADLVYSTPDENSNWFWGDFGGSRLDEPRQHDPLVMIASFLKGKSGIDNEDKIKILKAVYDSRHLAQERLWTGDHLKTANVVTNLRIYPEFRMAYTEKTLTIRNENQRKWSGDEEAIYTFHLPEGSAVSALSLWINGQEEKSRLTTKGKADSAYKTIVGVEVRDPSVLHWQEGNTVSVRVFPCNTKENRKFRIGVTSPLKKLGNTLQYENIWFDGPSAAHASEALEMTLSSPVTHLQTSLKTKNNIIYGLERAYLDKWTLSMDAPPLSKAPFLFGDAAYQLQESETKQINFTPKSVYLDINSSWSIEELMKIWPQLKDKKVYVYNAHLTLLNDKNLNTEFQSLSEKNFSLFPFYKIQDPANALVITKSDELSPNLSDLKGSLFQKNMSDFLAGSPAFHLYQIGNKTIPFLKTLKEFGAFRYSEGSIEKLDEHLKKHTLDEVPELEQVLHIPAAQMSVAKITSTPDVHSTKAPDHLLRLFAYNDILKKVGPSYFASDYVNEGLLKTADEAFIVSPVSSLIVLESKKDYERFGIDESKNSLKNASMNSSGAAPEPAEWMLIITTAIIMLYFMQKSGYLKKLHIS